MADMGMGRHGYGGTSGDGHEWAQHEMASMPGMDMEWDGHVDHAARRSWHSSRCLGWTLSGSEGAAPASETGNPLVDMQTMSPVAKLDDPGIGLRDNGRTVLTRYV